MQHRDIKQIVVIGLGYVGAPLAMELQKHFPVIGYDISELRIAELKRNYDHTCEIPAEELGRATWELTSDPKCLRNADVIIVTVPTPVTGAHVPDLKPVIAATNQIAQYAMSGVTIIYESTVFPGVTEDICVPLIEDGERSREYLDVGKLKHKHNFWVGYSPERINPGDKEHTLRTVTKIISGDSTETLDLVDHIYSKITKTYRAKSIKVAEAAKVIENTQRDVEIGLMNELSNIFGRLGIDTNDVIEAASSKWNFNHYVPGFVGGHCISVDPYYLTHASEQAGYVPSLILAAREVNERMPHLLAMKTIKAINKAEIQALLITVLGMTFKENVPDIRNSKVVNLVRELMDWGIGVQVVDPWANPNEVEHEYGIRLTAPENLLPATAIVLAVPHRQFVQDGWDEIMKYAPASQLVIVTDVKAVLDRDTKPNHVILVRP